MSMAKSRRRRWSGVHSCSRRSRRGVGAPHARAPPMRRASTGPTWLLHATLLLHVGCGVSCWVRVRFSHGLGARDWSSESTSQASLETELSRTVWWRTGRTLVEPIALWLASAVARWRARGGALAARAGTRCTDTAGGVFMGADHHLVPGGEWLQEGTGLLNSLRKVRCFTGLATIGVLPDVDPVAVADDPVVPLGELLATGMPSIASRRARLRSCIQRT